LRRQSRKRLFDVDSLLAPDTDKMADKMAATDDEQPEVPVKAAFRQEIDSTTTELPLQQRDGAYIHPLRTCSKITQQTHAVN